MVDPGRLAEVWMAGQAETRARTRALTRTPTRTLTRRGLLTALLLVPPALAGCAPRPSAQAAAPDPLIALAAAARADAALAAAVIAATPGLAGRVGPVRDARTEHAAALEAEVARQAGTTAAPGTPRSSAAPASGAATVDGLRRSVAAAAEAAGQVAMTADARRVGLVASVAACCTTYAAALG
jgi:hypothetical protein